MSLATWDKFYFEHEFDYKIWSCDEHFRSIFQTISYIWKLFDTQFPEFVKSKNLLWLEGLKSMKDKLKAKKMIMQKI